MKRTIGFAILAASALCLAAPVYAETFTTQDGVLSIDLPNENWKEMQDPSKWVTLSDGANLLTIDHFSNGEELPDMAVADDHFVNVYQAVFSTQNEVFIITGSVVDDTVIPDVTKAILSTKVLQFDTKMAIKKAEEKDAAAPADGFSVAAMNETMYATTGVNVRKGYTTADEILGGLAADTPVTVTGKVQKDGADFGWYQVSYNSGTGYVSAQFLTSTAPAKPASADSSFTGSAKTIYKADGTAVTVYQSTDGNWYDKSGARYTQTTDYEFVSADGNTTFSVNKPQNASTNTPAGDSFTVYWENGNAETLTPYSDGYYYSSGWVRYWMDSNSNAYIGADGTVLYGSMGGPSAPTQQQDDASEQHMLVSRDTGAEVLVSAGGGAYYDSSNTEYNWIDDGGMMDYYGHSYDVRW